MKKLRVVVGEDSYLVREGVVRTIDASSELESVGAEGTYAALLATIDRTLPDVVVTDIRMPPSGSDEGIRLAKQLNVTHPEIGVVVLSQHARMTFAVELFESGNPHRGYLLKERVADRAFLVEAIQSVARGVPVVDPKVAGMFIEPGEAQEALDSLTTREEQVLALLAEGASNAAIADALVVTTRAVERHINSIFAKLGLREQSDRNRRVVAALMYTRSHA